MVLALIRRVDCLCIVVSNFRGSSFGPTYPQTIQVRCTEFSG